MATAVPRSQPRAAQVARGRARGRTLSPAVVGRPASAAVRAFWERSPVASAAIPHPLGSALYFAYYDRLREANESRAFSARLHEYQDFGGRDVLDVGAGNGYVLSRYASAGARVHGVDLTRAGIDLCRRRFAAAGLGGHFVQADAERLPFRDGSFDCVCSMGVLHHTPDIDAAVAEIGRVLRPGGRLILMLYHRNSALYRLRFPLTSLVRGKPLTQLVNEVDGAGNPKGEVFSRAEARRLLSAFGPLESEVGLLQGWMLPPPLDRWASPALLARFEQRWGWFLYLKTNKPS